MSRDEMKLLVERLHALWSNGDLSVIPSIYAPDFVGHMSATSGMGTLRGHDAVRDAIAGVRDAVSGFTETVDQARAIELETNQRTKTINNQAMRADGQSLAAQPEQSLDFVKSCGFELDDHYLAMRDIAKRSAASN